MIWTIPNILTIIRLLAAPGLAVMFLYFDRPYADWFALLLFLLASITDWFDGYLARIWRQETKLGAMLDPICLLYTSPSPRDQRGSGKPG